MGTSQTTTVRDAARQHKKAYLPDKDKLNTLMDLEKDAAVNVKIKKGTEYDVIEKFASNPNGQTGSSVDDNKNADGDGSSEDVSNDGKLSICVNVRPWKYRMIEHEHNVSVYNLQEDSVDDD